MLAEEDLQQITSTKHIRGSGKQSLLHQTRVHKIFWNERCEKEVKDRKQARKELDNDPTDVEKKLKWIEASSNQQADHATRKHKTLGNKQLKNST